MKLSSKYIYTVTRIQRILAPIIGIWISGSWNILLRGKYRWICFMTIGTNVSLYPQWQKFLRERQPKTLIFWGQNDIFFTREGGEAYLKDLPNAEMYRLDSGHFAVEDCLNEIANNISRFYFERVFIRPA